MAQALAAANQTANRTVDDLNNRLATEQLQHRVVRDRLAKTRLSNSEVKALEFVLAALKSRGLSRHRLSQPAKEVIERLMRAGSESL